MTTATRPRDKDGVVDAALLIAREQGADAAEQRLQDELADVPRDLDDEAYQAEKNALIAALSAVRKQQRGEPAR